MYIRKYNKHFYKDSKTGSLIHVSKLSSYCPVEPVNAELKHERIVSQRWDLNRD